MQEKGAESSYRNEEVQAILDKYITEEKYSAFKPILDEMFHRRMAGFSFSKERIEEEAKNFSENCSGIVIKKERQNPDSVFSSPLAAYNPQTKEISVFISPETVKKEDARENFLRLMHEVYHATATHGFTTGLSHATLTGGYLKRDGDGLDETLNEKATIISGRDDSHEEILRNGYEHTNGYGGMTMYTNILSNALGVSERELISHGVGSREEFMDFYLSRFPETDKEEATQIFDDFERDINEIHRVDYKGTGELYALNRTGIDYRLSSAFKSLSKMFMLQTRHDSKDRTDEYYSELMYRAENMKKVNDSIHRILSGKGKSFNNPEDVVLEEYVASRMYYDSQGVSTDDYIYTAVGMKGGFETFYRLNPDRVLPEEAKYYSQKQRLASLEGPEKDAYKNRIEAEENIGITYDREPEELLQRIIEEKAKEIIEEENARKQDRLAKREAMKETKQMPKSSTMLAAEAILEDAKQNQPLTTPVALEPKKQGFFASLLGSIKNRLSSLFGNTAQDDASFKDAKELLIEERKRFEKDVDAREDNSYVDQRLKGIIAETEKGDKEETKEDDKETDKADEEKE